MVARMSLKGLDSFESSEFSFSKPTWNKQKIILEEILQLSSSKKFFPELFPELEIINEAKFDTKQYFYI